MKNLVLYLLLLISYSGITQSLYFPPTTGNNWDTISPSSLGWCDENVDSLIDHLENKNSKALIILKDGKIVIEHYYDQFTKDSLWYWASAGKTLTAFMVGMAQQEGHLNINDLSSQYMGTGWTNAPLAKENLITIKDQLSMTSGLDDTQGNVDCTIDTCLNYLSDAGTRWAYHNAPYTLLDSVVESATGVNLNTYVFQKLYASTGFLGSYIKLDFNNVFFSKPRMMARFGLLCLNNGNWDGTQVMTDTTYFNEMVNTSQNLNESYGYLWWLNGKNSFMLPSVQFNFAGHLTPDAPADMFSAIGKNGQILNIVPSENLVVVRMGNNPDNSLVPTTFVDTLWQYINKLSCSANSINENVLNDVSIYPNPTNDIIHISSKSNKSLTYKLSSIDGKSLSGGKTNQPINIEHLTNGYYLLSVFRNESSKTFKILKQ